MPRRRAAILALGALVVIGCTGSEDDTEGERAPDEAAVDVVLSYNGDIGVDRTAEIERVLRARLREFDVEDVDVRASQTGAVRIRFVPGDDVDVDEMVEVVTTGGVLRFRPVLATIPGNLDDGPSSSPPAPDGFELTDPQDDVPDQPVVLEQRDGTDVVETAQLGPTIVTGRAVETASAQLSPAGMWSVNLVITAAGIDSFNDLAQTCFGRATPCPTGRLAIVLDSQIVSAPMIQQSTFERDQIVISGDFTEAEAKELALVLRYGSLPTVLEVESVGPAVG